MDFTSLPLPYLKELASQIIFISAFLGGFSAAILGTLIVTAKSSRVLRLLIVGTSLSAVSFIVAVFAMTKIVMMSIPGYPVPVEPGDFFLPQVIGSIAFFLGIIALMVVVGVSGWLQSRRLGMATTAIALFGLILILISS